MQQVLSITQINEYIRAKMDADSLLPQVAVRGEISNYKQYPSGHHYFTLKDNNAALKCVMFKGNAMRLRFRPENGMQVIALGKISVYPRDGAYQLYCTALSIDGVGDLYAAFEQLKAKMEAQGLFEQSHKKALPKYPDTIGIVTSSAGAAVHDMLRIINKRFPLSHVRLFPVRVQGSEAPGEISSAIRFANQYKLADLLIVGRGGGSIEDLWAFNDEIVARAIYASEIPVISAVGHEPDVTISDYVADLRAATPSNAAELAVPDQENLLQILDSAAETLTGNLRKHIKTAQQRLDVLSQSAVLRSPEGYLSQKERELDLFRTRMIAAQERALDAAGKRWIASVSKLDAMSPLKVLSRGYAFAATSEGEILRSVSQVESGDIITVTLNDGRINAVVSDKRGNSNE